MDDEATDLATAKADPQTGPGRAAIARILARHRGLIVRWCNRLALGGFDLDDMIQEAHLAGMDAIKWFDPAKGFKFSTYLKRCVLNRLAKWRADRRQVPLPQEGEDESLDLVAAHEAVDPSFLARAMAELSPLEKQVLSLKFGLSGGGAMETGDVGRRLGLSRETVEWVEWQAKLALKARATTEEG